MRYPIAGDVAIPGTVAFCIELPIFGASRLHTRVWFGLLEASDEIYDSGVSSDGTDPLQFSFWSLIQFNVGDTVVF